MTGIIFRYLFAEVGRTWLVVAGVLVFLTLGLGFARFIADAAAGELPVNTVLELALFKLVENLEIVLPVSMLLGVLLTLGRLCRDNEMAALFAGGAGLREVYTPFIVVALLVATLAGTMSIVAAPHAERALARLSGADRDLDQAVETAMSRAVKKACQRVWGRRPVVETTVLRL